MVDGWLENWRVMLSSTQIVIEVDVEIGNISNRWILGSPQSQFKSRLRFMMMLMQ